MRYVIYRTDTNKIVSTYLTPPPSLAGHAHFTEDESVAPPNCTTDFYDSTAPTKRRVGSQTEIDTHKAAVLDVEVKSCMDNERTFSALVWAIIDTYSAPATVAKYNSARTKIIAAYKAQPWKA